MDFQQQYELIKSSRKILFDYCQTLSGSDFLIQNSSFGRGSVRNLLVHIGNVYEYWMGRQALNKEINFTEYNYVSNAKDAEEYFISIDCLVQEFINAFSKSYLTEMKLTIDKKIVIANALKIFTHVITHEFHHKGQVLSLTRHLGYIPVDTDIIR